MSGHHQRRAAAGGGVVPFSYSFRETNVSGTDLSTYTFSSADIGSSASAHHVLIAVGAKKSSSGTATVTSVTVGGQSCSALATATNSQSISTLWITDAEITSTTGDVVVSGNTKNRLGVAIYEIYGLDSTTAIDTGSLGGSRTYSDTLTSTVGSACFVTSFTGAGASYWTAVSGVTEDYDVDVESGRLLGGGSVTAASTTQAFEVEFNTNNSQTTHAAVTLGN